MRLIPALGGAAVVAVFVGACGPSPFADQSIDGTLQDAGPLAKDLPHPQTPDRPDEPAGEQASFQPPTGKLRLPDALAAALMHNPELAAFSAEIRAKEARALQAELWPNPVGEIEVEEFGRQGNAVENMENVIRLKQPILTAGKIEKRTRVAELKSDLTRWDYRSTRLDVFTRVVRRFIAVLEAQRRIEVAQQTYDLAEQVHETVVKQVDAGQVSPVEQTRAEVELSNARIELRRARRALKRARYALAETWGGKEPEFAKALGDLGEVDRPPKLDAIAPLVKQNPDVARWKTELAERRAEVDLAEARAWPNVTPGVGVQRFWGTEDTAAKFSVGVPLPIFDRNQGNILAERYNVIEAAQRQREAQVEARSELGQAYQDLQAAYEEIQTLRNETVPGAESAYQAIRQSYQAGQTDFLEVLDAQRTLFEAERRLVQSLGEYQRQAAEVERLIAQSLDSVRSDASQPEPAQNQPGHDGPNSQNASEKQNAPDKGQNNEQD